jgi:hypothetical protein
MQSREDVQRFLVGLQWPGDESGYLMIERDDLPPYRVLAQLLAERGIPRELTWTKEDCLNALGEVPEFEIHSENPVSENLFARVRGEICRQQDLANRIREATAGLGRIVEHIVTELEDAHIQRQQQIMQ